MLPMSVAAASAKSLKPVTAVPDTSPLPAVSVAHQIQFSPQARVVAVAPTQSLLPVEFLARTCTWYSVSLPRPVMVIVVSVPVPVCPASVQSASVAASQGLAVSTDFVGSQ